jgi:hypothetical protein
VVVAAGVAAAAAVAEGARTIMLDNQAFRAIFFIAGLGLVLVGSCGAMEKISDEGWNGPSSKPGAAKLRR